jgi:hypothetical protein
MKRPFVCVLVLCVSLFVITRNLSADGTLAQVSIETVTSQIESIAPTHPRLLADADTFASLRNSIGDTSSPRDMLARYVITYADALASVPPIQRELTGRRLLGESRRFLARMLNLSMAYQLTLDEKYVDRGKQEMLAVAAFSDWNPSHFLDVAEMTLAMAIGYDWMFDALSPADRTTIRRAIIEKSVSLPFETKHRNWVTATNNWGQVCHGGLTAGALAILEDEPELAARTVVNAVENVPRSMKAFAPHGGYPEGPAYWAYGTSYNVILIAILDSVLGEDFGLSQLAGFDQTGQYLALVTGPSGDTFNYADGGARRSPEPVLYWFAKKFRRNDWLLGESEILSKEIVDFQSRDAGSGDNRLLPLALLWMNANAAQLAEEQITMPLSWCSGSDTPIAVHRSSWTGSNATFVGIKAGSPAGPHGQMDSGSFVLDADGVRWAIDLGAENYHGIEARGMNLWSASQQSDRWTIFRQSNFGHNTLVIDEQLQVAKGQATIVAFSDKKAFPHTIVDLSDVYRGQASSVQRGVALSPSGEVLIQDELTGLKPSSHVRWGMITTANAVLPDRTDSGRQTLRLQQHEQHLEMTIVEPAGAHWKIVDTATPRNPWDSKNPGTRMIAFEAEAPPSGELQLVVIATPGSSQDPQLRTSDQIKPLANW